MKKKVKLLLILSMLSVISACTTVDKRYTDYLNLQNVELRVSERWNALIQKDYAKAYQYVTPSYKHVVTELEYSKTINPRVKWKKFDIMRTRCEEDICKVNVEVSYSVPPMFGIPRGMESVENVKETWMFQEGEWFFLPPMSK